MSRKEFVYCRPFFENLSPEQVDKMRREFLDHFSEIRDYLFSLKTNDKAANKSANEFAFSTVDDILEKMRRDPGIYHEIIAYLRPETLIRPPQAYRISHGYEKFEKTSLAQCQEDVRCGLPTGVFDFDEMGNYDCRDHPEGMYCQEPRGLHLLCLPGLPSPENVAKVFPSLQTNYRLVIAEESGVDLYIHPELHAGLSPACAGLYLVAPGILQLTLKTTGNYDDEDLGDPFSAVPFHGRRQESCFFHATLFREGNDWKVSPGMSDIALQQNKQASENGGPVARPAPFLERLFKVTAFEEE